MLRRKVLSLATALVSLVPGLAVAQDNTTPPPAPPPAAEPAAPAAAPVAAGAEGDQGKNEKTEEIVVTGSRIRRKDLNTPAPVTVMSKEQYTASGKVSLGDFLQSLPEQGNALNTQVNNGNDGSVQVNLRSLGPQRTLVLVNGRRFVSGGLPSSPLTAVDLNTIPAAAIERIEILKDGGSAIYGSDAVAGVVNVILKKRYSGTEVSAYSGTTSHGDGTTFDLSAVTGTTSDRGNILFSLGYQDQHSVLSGDRAWAETPFSWDFDLGEKVATGNSTTFPAGRFTLDCSAPATAAATAACASAGATTRKSLVPEGGNTYKIYDSTLFNTNPTNYLITPNRRYQLFATGDTNIGSVARGFFEVSYVNRTSAQTLAPMPLVNSTIPLKPITVTKDSFYNPFGVDITSWRIRTVEFGDRRYAQNLNTARVVTGLDGNLGDAAGFLKGWTWDVSYNYGQTSGTELDTGQLRMPNIGNATGPSVLDTRAGSPTFNQPVCVRSSQIANPLDPSNIIAGCVPMDVLHGFSGATRGANPALTQAAKQYVSYDGTLNSAIRQDVVSANVSGELFSLMADRPIGLAIGGDWRREAGRFLPDPITAALESSGNNYLPTAGAYDVREGYAELSVPLVSGMPLVNQLEASAAIRVFDYSSFGSDSTYKFGARYSPIRDVTLRGTYSTAFRAPNVPELYGGTTDSYDFVNSGDPCSGPTDPAVIARCAALGVPGGDSGDASTQFLTKKIANANLKPEKANVYTIGVVLEPTVLPNFSFTVDYFNIDLRHEISTRGALTILNQCVLQNNDQLCSLITRNGEGQVIQINDQRNNGTQLKTAGFDFSARYAVPTSAFGRFNLIVDAAYLQQYTTIDEFGFYVPNAGNYDNLNSLPRFKMNSGVVWGLGSLGAGVTNRYVSGFKECESGLCASNDPTDRSRRIAAWYAFDAFVTYGLRSSAGKTSIALGVQNVFDSSPPFITNAGSANSDPSTYDYLGRFFYARLTQSF